MPTLTLSAQQQRTVRITPQNDRQLAGVIICYKAIGTVNGVPWPQIYFDKYPSTITDYTPNVLTHIVELAGWKVTKMVGQVAVTPIAPAFATTGGTAGDGASIRAAFWLGLDQTLQDPAIKPASITAAVPVSVVNAQTGAAINLANYPNILLPAPASGPVQSWMGVNWVEAIVTLQHGFSRYQDPGTWALLDASVTRYCTMRVMLTNAVTQTYTGSHLDDTGDPVPPLYPAAGSLAQTLYNSLSVLQYEGQISLLAPALTSGIGVGNVLTLVTPNNTYHNLLVQSVSGRPHFGELRLNFGPAAPRDLPGLISLWESTRWRTTYNMPSGRASGTAQPIASVDASGAAAKQDTAHSAPSFSSLTITGS